MVLLKNSWLKAEGSKHKLHLAIFSLLAVFCLLPTGSALAEEKVYKINVEGMHCNMCVYRVTKSLKKLKQVKDVNVSLDNGNATVTLNEGEEVTAEAFNGAIEDSGYKPNGVEVVMANSLPAVKENKED